MRLTDEQFGAELNALRELPSERFAAELDAWAAEGFPSLKQLEEPKAATAKRGHRKGFLGFVMQRPALSALAGGAAVVLIVGGSVAAYLASRENVSTDSLKGDPFLSAPSSTNGEINGSARVQSAPQSAAALPPTEPLPPTSRPRNGRPQVQERTAQLGLASDSDKLQDAADGVVDVTERYDGFVDSSNVHTAGSRGRAHFQLRIPTQHLQDALSDLSDLGRVTLLNQGSNNVTGSYVDAGKAYADARANVHDLREQLRNASSPSEAAAIRAQLDMARQQLAAARAGLRGLKQRVAYTPVSVEITAQGDGSWSIGDAADDAVGVLEAIGGAVLIALAVLIPLGALLALGWLGTRELRRRRREAALD
jgi:hypothetical protein